MNANPYYIAVEFDLITNDQYDQVIKCYNENKADDWNPISKLDRAEGGFQIELKEHEIFNKNNKDPNYMIKQLRWCNKKLTTKFIPFNEQETKILFNSLQNVFHNDVKLLQK